MKPAPFNLEVYRGDTYAWQFVLWTDAAHTVPFDLAGKTVHAEIRDRPMGGTVVPLEVTVTAPNTVDIALELADAGLPFSKGSWDLRVFDTDSRDTVLAGAVIVTKDTTDST
jgi:hypothetical protein